MKMHPQTLDRRTDSALPGDTPATEQASACTVDTGGVGCGVGWWAGGAGHCGVRLPYGAEGLAGPGLGVALHPFQLLLRARGPGLLIFQPTRQEAGASPGTAAPPESLSYSSIITTFLKKKPEARVST